MSLTLADRAPQSAESGVRLNPAALKIDLLCCGLRLDDSCCIHEKGRPVSKMNEGPDGGLELILPGEIKELRVNVPTREGFVKKSPYRLSRKQAQYFLHDDRNGRIYPVKPAPRPDWYDLKTKRGVPMSDVALMQGTFLLVDFGQSDRPWAGNSVSGHLSSESSRGKCNSSATDAGVEDVVETAKAAQNQSGITFALFRGGGPSEGGLARVFSYIQALKSEVGILVGAQFPPETELGLYEHARDLGVDHFSFHFDSYGERVPGHLGRHRAPADRLAHTIKAIEHCARIMGRGRVSGELVAGIEPIEQTKRGIDYFVRIGTIPLIAIFRPLLGTETEDLAPPGFEEMIEVFRYVYQTCSSHNLPIGLAPNIRLSALPHPEDTLYLAPDMTEGENYRRWILTMQQTMRPYFLRRIRKQIPPGI